MDTGYGFHTAGVYAVPITGDFNIDGITDVGIYQPNNDHFYLDYLNNQAQSIGQVDAAYGFHDPGVFADPLPVSVAPPSTPATTHATIVRAGVSSGSSIVPITATTEMMSATGGASDFDVAIPMMQDEGLAPIRPSWTRKKKEHWAIQIA